jgi:hypothetical protein
MINWRQFGRGSRRLTPSTHTPKPLMHGQPYLQFLGILAEKQQDTRCSLTARCWTSLLNLPDANKSHSFVSNACFTSIASVSTMSLEIPRSMAVWIPHKRTITSALKGSGRSAKRPLPTMIDSSSQSRIMHVAPLAAKFGIKISLWHVR